MTMKIALLALSTLLAFGTFAGEAGAAQCPGTQTFVFMAALMRADMRSSLAGSSITPGFVAPLHTFIGSAGCSTSKFGPVPPDQCVAVRFSGFPTGNPAGNYKTAFVWARWTESASSLWHAPSNGCVFMCPGGTCTVRASDGLPVELMHFGVE